MPNTLDTLPMSEGESHHWLRPTSKSPHLARQLLRELLARVEGGERFADIGQLVLSELVTNAVLHARVPGRLIWTSFAVNADRLRLEVHDASSDRRPVLATATEEDESGRGLFLVKALSRRWGCCPRGGGVGKALWVEIGPQ
ncbi:anti-sigma regulatory factor (Ser/Thr protein kinase) [Kitasatospora sp. MAA4]|uniref:ATP-binding protein n=1 Tax=Kitasatospora sp. MAA4 TaxID=3035093 RepID=UPI002476E441|nr:ATP-binding protein [Kitasatospora sp. MAA4]MDH6137691.1 anti-sigma regulatory factor (Ser/Thr protein kinase) [Kitasatospora sp. MAA4]